MEKEEPSGHLFTGQSSTILEELLCPQKREEN